MTGRDIVVVGGSAGGIEALRGLVAGLPPDLAAAVLVVVHTPATSPGLLPRILARDTALPVAHARDGEALRPGRVYVAVPDHHLLIRDGTVRLSRSARQNRARPAVDALFRSAARWCGARVIAVVLSGALDDGAVGTAVIHAHGGVAVIQDPDEATFDGMPRAALIAVDGYAVVSPAKHLGTRIADLVAEPFVASPPLPDPDLIRETDMTESEHPYGALPLGTPAGLGCPECNGGMSVIGDAATTHYRCHTGHSYSPQTLVDAQREKVETALWTAISFMEEQSMIHQHLAARDAGSGDASTVDHRIAGQEAARAAATLRRRLEQPMSARGDDAEV
jgi:two-component system chemotaxis response regulator CheB